MDLQIRRLLNIRDNEGLLLLLVSGIMLFTSAGFTLGSTGVETLFYTRFGVQYLPGMYMLLGISSFLASLGITALLGRLRRESFYLFILLSIAGLVVLAWGALLTGWPLVYPVLWLGKEIINSLLGLLVWGLAGAVCDTRQSKRLFPIFNAGRILGTVIGGLTTGLLASLAGTGSLLLIWAGLLIVSLLFTRILLKTHRLSNPASQHSHRKTQPSFIQEMQQGFHFTRTSALMRLVSLASILFSVLYFSIALPFSQGAAAHFPDEHVLAGFLGGFNGLTTAAAFVVSFFAANRLFSRFGIMNAILVLPLIYLVGFGGMVISPIFTVIYIFRFVQMVWLSGMTDSAYQAMFNAVPERRREQVRAFINGVPAQAGTFIAGAILIVGMQAFTARELALIGVIVASFTTYTIWRARSAYTHSLVETLRLGQPTLFGTQDRPSLPVDSVALQVMIAGSMDPDPSVRLLSTKILGQVNLPIVIPALVKRLSDPDEQVRLVSLEGLARPEAVPALLEISACLEDPSPAVRALAVDTLPMLTPFSSALQSRLSLLLDLDPSLQVRMHVAVVMIKLANSQTARTMLRQTAILGDEAERILALHGLAEVADQDARILFETELTNLHAPIGVRHAAAIALGHCGPPAIPVLQSALSTENLHIQAGVATALGQIGEPALSTVIDALINPQSEPGALTALEQLPAWKESQQVCDYIRVRVATALNYNRFHLALSTGKDPRLELLNYSLTTRAQRDALFALRAFGQLHDREALTVVIENLQSHNPLQVSNALETLETVQDNGLIKPLFRIWDPDNSGDPGVDAHQVFLQLMQDEDEWLQSCAKYANNQDQEDRTMAGSTALSIMDRVILLHQVPLLADLTPHDLQHVAAISTDLDFMDGELICEQGEPGDQMYVIVSGEVRIVIRQDRQKASEIARRVTGEVVGEMSIISGEPRVASVIAVGEVHTLCLDRLNFESLLRERPEISLAVMRELCKRLSQLL